MIPNDNEKNILNANNSNENDKKTKSTEVTQEELQKYVKVQIQETDCSSVIML